MAPALALLPVGAPAPDLPDGVVPLPYAAVTDVIAALAGADGGAVLCADGIDDADLADVAAAVRAAPGTVVEVRSAPWDGETHSPLSAACAGVIAGFGLEGVRAAALLLLRAAPSSG